MKARCAPWFRVALSQSRVVRALVVLNVIPVKVWCNSMWYESSLCRVIPFKVISTPRGANARCAGVIPVSVVQIGAVACIASKSVVHASAWLFTKALAQHALAADAASRRARSGLFQRQFLLQCDCHLPVAAPLKRNPFGGFIQSLYQIA